MWIRSLQREAIKIEPAHRIEFLAIERQITRCVTTKKIPERDIGMSGCGSYRTGHRQEQRIIRKKLRLDPQLFAHLTPHRLPRMLTRLDMSPRRQPQPRLNMINQEQLFLLHINENKVGDEMFGGNVRRLQPKQRSTGIDPRKGVGDVICFDGIEWGDVGDDICDCLVHWRRGGVWEGIGLQGEACSHS